MHRYLSQPTRTRIILLRNYGYTSKKVVEKLKEEHVVVSKRHVNRLFNKFRLEGKISINYKTGKKTHLENKHDDEYENSDELTAAFHVTMFLQHSRPESRPDRIRLLPYTDFVLPFHFLHRMEKRDEHSRKRKMSLRRYYILSNKNFLIEHI